MSVLIQIYHPFTVNCQESSKMVRALDFLSEITCALSSAGVKRLLNFLVFF